MLAREAYRVGVECEPIDAPGEEERVVLLLPSPHAMPHTVSLRQRARPSSSSCPIPSVLPHAALNQPPSQCTICCPPLDPRHSTAIPSLHHKSTPQEESISVHRMTHRRRLDLAPHLPHCDPPYGHVSVLLPAGELLALARRLAIPPQHRHLTQSSPHLTYVRPSHGCLKQIESNLPAPPPGVARQQSGTHTYFDILDLYPYRRRPRAVAQESQSPHKRLGMRGLPMPG